MPGSPPVASVRNSAGPRLRFSMYSGCFICAAVLAYGARYWPVGMFSDRSASSTASSWGSFAKSLRWKGRNMWLCILMSIVMVAWMVLGWAFLPLYYIKVKQYSPQQMSILMSVLGLSAAFFSFVVPGLSDRLGRRPVVIAFNLLGAVVP